MRNFHACFALLSIGFSSFAFAQDNFDEVFAAPPGFLTRPLEQAKYALAVEDYTAAIEYLSPLVGLDAEQALSGFDDYFMPTRRNDATKSIRQQAWTLIENLPARGRSLFELKYGIAARKKLTDAITTNDSAKLGEVATRYRHTKAGYVATFLLGKDKMSRGEFAFAIRFFQKLYDWEAARQAMDPELTIQYALALTSSGKIDSAVDKILSLKVSHPLLKFSVGGEIKSHTVLDADSTREFLQELQKGYTETVGSSSKRMDDEWLSYRSRDNLLIGQNDFPLHLPEWSVTVANDKTSKVYRRMEKQRVEELQPILPVHHPIALKGNIIFRASNKTYAVDLQTGKRVWIYPWSHQDQQVSSSEMENIDSTSTRQNLWSNSADGRITSDGTRIYFVQGSYETEPLLYDSNLLPRQIETSIRGNSLVALKVIDDGGYAVEGQLAWKLDPLSKNTAFSGAVFLGPPLVHHQVAYVLYELNGQIRIAALKSNTGELIWSQQLASTQSRDGYEQQVYRYRKSTTPIFANGLLICPTMVGGLVAIDLTDQSLKWGLKYETLKESRFTQALDSLSSSFSPWLDDALFVMGDSLCFSPIDSRNFFVIRLETGRTRLAQPKEGNRMVAGHYGDQLVIVGRHFLTIHPVNGLAKNKIDFGEYGVPAGSGIFADRYFYLPVSNRKLLKFDLHERKIVEVIETARQLGNLCHYSGRMISQSIYGLEAYPLKNYADSINAGDEQLERRNASSWLIKSQLLRVDGKLDQSIETAIRSLQIAPTDLSSGYLARLLRERVQTGDNLDWQLLQKGFALLQNPKHRRAFLLAKIEANLSSGRSVELLGDLVTLIDHYTPDARSQEELIELSRNHSVSGLRLVRTKLKQASNQLDAKERDRFVMSLRDRYRAALEAGNVQKVRLISELVGEFDFVKSEYPKLVQSLIASNRRSDLIWVKAVLMEKLASEKEPSQRNSLIRILANLGSKIYESQDLVSKSMLRRTYEALLLELDATQGQGSVANRNTRSVLKATLSNLGDSDKEQHAAPTSFPDGLTRIKHYEGEDVELLLLDAQDRRNRSRRQFVRRFADLSFDIEIDDRGIFVIRDHLGNPIYQGDIRGRGSRQISQRFDISSYQVLGDLLILTCGYDHVALDLSRIASREWKNPISDPLSLVGESIQTPNDIELWRFNGYKPSSDFNSIRLGRESNALDLVVNKAVDTRGFRIGRSTNLSAKGFCLLSQGSLICLDPWTGQTIWKRTGIKPGSDLLGDEEFVYVIAADERTVEVFNSLDGTRVGQLAVPPNMVNRFVQYGSQIVSLREEDASIQVFGFRLQSDQIDQFWKKELPKGSKADLLDSRTLAVLTPNGNFLQIDVESGETRQVTLDIDSSFSTIQTIRLGSELLLICNRRNHTQIESLRTSFAGDTRNLINVDGQVLMLNDQGPLWASPAMLDRYDLVLNQPSATPVLLFKKSTSPKKTELIFLRRSDGSLIKYSAPLKHFGPTTNLKVKSETNSYTFNLGYQWLELRLTDFPRPPEPPAQTGKYAGGTEPDANQESKPEDKDPFVAGAEDDPFGNNSFFDVQKWVIDEWKLNPMNRSKSTPRTAD